MQTIDRVGSEQTRARYPDSEGYVERDGVRHLLHLPLNEVAIVGKCG